MSGGVIGSGLDVGGVASATGPGVLRRAVVPTGRPTLTWMTPAWLCVFAAFALSLLGLAAIDTARPAVHTVQVVFLCVGVVAATAAAIVPYRLLEALSVPIMLIVLGMLIFVLLPFIPEEIVRPRKGARRWISVGVDIQPSELCKIAYCAGLAAYLVHARHYRRFLGIFKPLALTFIPMVLILMEPDLGTSLLFLPALFVMLLAAGSRMRHLVIIVLLGLAPTPFLYGVLQDHQQKRIDGIVAQWRGQTHLDDDENFQVSRAIRLTGSGGAFGLGGPQSGTLVRRNSLPEPHNDMIFAVISARWGFAGGLATYALYGLFAIGALLTAAQTSDPFGRLLVLGLVTMLLMQMIVNTGMTMGLLPITGMTLPFVSYGGSSLVTAWTMVGVIVSVGVRWPAHLAREALDFDDYAPETA